MVDTIRTAGLTILSLALGLATNAAKPTPAVAGGGVSAPQAIKVDTLTKQQLDQQIKGLPDNAMIESKGQRMTKAQVRALATQKGKQHHAKAQAAIAQNDAAFEQRRAQFEEQQQAKLQADRTKAMAEFTRLQQAGSADASAQLEVIQREAVQLFQRSKTASPAEQWRIDQRAGQLLQQLQQMGR
jgi:hypothetical protein